MRTLVVGEMKRVSGGRSATEGIALAGTIGGGVAAAKVIARAGGLAEAGIAAGTAYAAGLFATGVVGYEAGTYLYENSGMVREVAQGTVGYIVTQGFRTTMWQGVQILFGGGLIGGPGREGHLDK